MKSTSGPWGWLTASLAIVAVASFVAAPAVAQDPMAQRGRELYETRCGNCHDRSVHQAASRKAASFAELRAAVLHWDRQQGGLWRDEELDAVARYLNERYYRLPCPVSVCGAQQPPMRTSMVRSPASGCAQAGHATC
jgi:hypothetical protein